MTEKEKLIAQLYEETNLAWANSVREAAGVIAEWILEKRKVTSE